MDKFKKYITGFRKLSFAVLLLIVTVSLLVSNYIDGSNFAMIWTATAPAFMAANLIEWGFKYLKEKARDS